MKRRFIARLLPLFVMLCLVLFSSCKKDPELPRLKIELASDEFLLKMENVSGNDLLADPNFVKDLKLRYSYQGNLYTKAPEKFLSLETPSMGTQRYVVFSIPQGQSGTEGSLLYYKDIFLAQSGTKSSVPAEIIYYWSQSNGVKKSIEKIVYLGKTYTKNSEGIIVVPVLIAP